MSAGTFLGIMALMFVLELPDKTMVATIVMSTRARPRHVALGAAAGFVVQMAIAVTAGGLLTLLPPRARDAIVAALFLGGAAYLLLAREREVELHGEQEAERERAASPAREIGAAFGVIFLGEFGDLTQIQAASLTAHTHDPVAVFAAGSLALVVVAYLGAFGGRLLQRWVPTRVIRRIGGAVFAILGVLTLVQAVRA